ncbi:dihydroxyacetone kinase [Mesoplasma florum L1]|uniref:Dihydroxyacetone kinase n=2 Tax=Mesoplasma florum TaxID=2151 RepID=Q6F1N7_MESFL|nr:DAK2 domain-containing protein [Mesoplasma florum]AAT75586.1 dihydroxyacetone kinase [Mesoplasma florum L1]AGY41302.1 Dihydroxyacetone kinase family protein [Mesoplasma florum W37]ATI73871.1 dihydroxyacetone kinase [Mesoplasma florum]AVN58837.1 dihydroxyacetone kinase [Mesoplasma florum]AVN59528.1 dihydroxyacetone kinase [Mesoplasma florum]
MEKLILIKDSMTSAVNNLYNNYPHIDKLNVFPVPDGDTGTNMNLTATNGYNDVKDIEFKTIGEFLNAFSRGLIMGARGNSGVIFSQIIKGLAKGMNDASELSAAEWKKGFAESKIIAYRAVMKPVEGTILTVIREVAEQSALLPDDMEIKEFWNKIILIANEALENTPNLLQALKDVGVVDSGAYGLVKFLEGMNSVFQSNKIIAKTDKLEINEGGNIEMEIEAEFGYCTEGIVMLNEEWINKLQTSAIRDQLQIYGNTSIVVVIDEDILKVHTHALSPGQVLMFLQQYGDFKTIKVDNMNLQADKQVKGNEASGWQETTSIKLERKLNNDYATIAVVSSPEMKKYFEKELGIDIAIDGGSKMNPSTNDFLKAIEEVDAKAVYLMPNNGNVLLAAKQAEKEETKSKIIVIPTKTIQQGMTAALSFDPSATTMKNTKAITSAIKNVISFQVSQAAKDSVVNGIKIKKDQQMAIVDGKIVGTANDIGILFEKQLSRYITNKTEIITIFIGQDASAKSVSQLRKFLDENFDVEYEIIEGGQKVYSFIIAVE